MHARDFDALNLKNLNEIARLNRYVSRLDERLARVENKLFDPASSRDTEVLPSHEGETDIQLPQEEISCQNSVQNNDHVQTSLPVLLRDRPESTEEGTGNKTADADYSEDHESKTDSSSNGDKQSTSESLEARIGLYWLNRIGIASLVIGMALFLMYSFQSFGAVAKIVTGFITAFSILSTGEWIESRGGPKWYARGLQGGAWALVYFTTYAMHYVPSVELVHSVVVDLILLAGVSALTMWHAIKKNSEIVALLSVVLGFITVTLTDPGVYSAAATAVLVASSSLIAVKMRWHQLLFWSVIASYSTFFIGLRPAISALNLTETGTALLTAAHAGVYWTIYNLALLQMDEDTVGHRTMLIVASLVNACGFFVSMNHVLAPIQEGTEYLFPLAVALGYAMSCPFAKEKRTKALYNVHTLLALTFATSAVPMIFKSDWFITFWIAEVAVLAFTGLRYQIRPMRWFAVALAALSGLFAISDLAQLAFKANMTEIQVIVEFALAFASFGLAAVAYRAANLQAVQGQFERNSFFNLYFMGAGFFAMLLPVVAFSPDLNRVLALSPVAATNLIAVSWLIEACAGKAYGLSINSKFVRAGSYFLFASIVFSQLFSDSLYWWTTALVSTVMFGKALHCRHSRLETNEREVVFAWGTGLAALLALVQTWSHCSSVVLPLTLASEGALLVTIGYLERSSYLRGLGALFCLATGLVMANSYTWAVVPTLMTSAIFYGIGVLYRRARKEGIIENQAFIPHLYELGGTAIITYFISQQLPLAWLCPAWSIEAFALLIAGFACRDKSLRISGLAVLGLVAGRLLFVELAGAETIQRIVSFIVAGVILLASSYGYSGFMRRFLGENSKTPESA